MKNLLPLLLTIGSNTATNAAVTNLDLTTSGVGSSLESSPYTYTFSGVTLTASATSNFGSNTAIFNATASNAGVDTTGATSANGDTASEIDAGEILTFTFNFSNPVSEVTIINIDFNGIGNASDSASVQFPDGVGGTASVTLIDSSTNFSYLDIWTPSGGITFQDGDQISFSNSSAGSFYLQTMSLNVVPEPSSTALLGLGGLTLIMRRRK